MVIQQISPKHTKINIDQLSVLSSKKFGLTPFDEQTINFAHAFSKGIFADKLYSRIPALTSLAFWLRRSNFQKIANDNLYLTQQPNVFLSPIGVVFHVCPANVDTMFIYSLMVSLLMGNKNILRISNRLDHAYISFLFTLLNELLAQEDLKIISDYINIVTYDHDIQLNTYFSGVANARLIWGGDNTAKIFKNISSNPRIKDIIFSDRISTAIFKTAVFLTLNLKEQKEVVKNFYNDAYTFDQKGCSSPQTIFLYGEKSSNTDFETVFYKLLDEVSDEKYGGDNASLASLKFNRLVSDVLEDHVLSFRRDTATLYLVETNSDTLLHTCGGGYFYTRQVNKLEDILPFVSTKMQTLSYFGLTHPELEGIAKMSAGIGIDRIVPIGKALDFNYLWDGFNLFEELSSKKVIL